MAPNSRPPLTSRIRASFDGKRTKSQSGRVMSPTDANSFGTQDSDSLRTAIDEAINSEIFQKAIAANLAKLIKPSIKSALDTIQPVVEAVYSHELLLRKTNRSVEDILIRLDEKAERRESIATHRESVPPEDVSVTRERAVSSASVGDLAQHRQLLLDNHTKTTSALTQLSISVKASNGKIAEALQGISDVDTKLRWSSESIESLKSTSEQSNTTIAVLQAQLDRLKKDMGQIMASIGPDLGKSVQALSQSSQSGAPDTSLFNSHTTKLDAISTDLAALKGHSDTVEKIDAVSTELASLKASVDAGITANSEGLTGLGSQISNVLTTLEGHTGTLGEIKDKGPHPEILAALQQSNDSHAAHAASLGEIKERAEAPTESIPSERGSPETTAALQDLKSDLASLWENIEAGLTSNNENVMSVGAKVDNVLATIEGHKASDPSADILAAVQASNDSHASHAAALEELKSREVAPAPALDNSELTTQINTLAETLNAHTATLDEIKAGAGAHAAGLEELMSRESPGIPPMGSIDSASLASLEIQIGSIVKTLDAQTSALKQLNPQAVSESTEMARTASSGSDDALSDIMTTIVETLEIHTMLLNEMKEDVSAEILTTLHDLSQTQANQSSLLEEIREADLSDEVLTLLHASSESHANHSAALDKIDAAVQAANESHASHTASLDTQLGAITASLEEHKNALLELKDATAKANEAHASHTAAFADLKSVQPVEVAPVSEEVIDLSPIEGHLATIIGTLEGQTATLAEIKEASSQASPELLASVKVSHDLLTSHTALLDAIKDASSHEDTLTNITELKSIISDSHAEHSTLFKDLHTEIKDSHSSLDSAKEKIDSVAAQIDINHTTVTTSITTLSDELKAEVDATGTHVSDQIINLSSNLGSVNLAVAGCTQSSKSVEGKLENLESSIKQTGSFVVGLYEGVHLNDTGVGQLQEQLKGKGLEPPIAEGAWFKKKETRRAVSPSPLREVETVSPPAELQGPLVEEGEEMEEEMPSIDAPEAAIEETAIAEPLEESPAVEAEITEAQASEKPKEVIAETPAVDESLEESPAVESSEDIKEVEKPIAEAPTEETAIPKTLEEPVAVESIEEAKEIEEHPDADAPESELVQEDEVHPESDAIVAEEDLPKVEESAPAVEDVHDEPSPEIEYPADHARDEA
ncbi:hypothetical protein BDZ45DRAFT_634334, partial [Acephala macrosclerotiorum]